jgi:hypothetical protein
MSHVLEIVDPGPDPQNAASLPKEARSDMFIQTISRVMPMRSLT